MALTFSHDTTQTFVDALHQIDDNGDTETMAALFTDDASVRSIDGQRHDSGPAGITNLFTTYRKQFERLSTTFTAVTESEGGAALEWETEATGVDGRDIFYRGVTIIEIDGEKLTRFATVYDSAALLQRPAIDGPSGGTAHHDATDPATAGHTGADSGLLDESDRAASEGSTP